MNTNTTLAKLLTPAEAANLLGVKVQTLALWRSAKRHKLPFVKVGSAVRYKRADLEAWVARNTVKA